MVIENLKLSHNIKNGSINIEFRENLDFLKFLKEPCKILIILDWIKSLCMKFCN